MRKLSQYVTGTFLAIAVVATSTPFNTAIAASINVSAQTFKSVSAVPPGQTDPTGGPNAPNNNPNDPTGNPNNPGTPDRPTATFNPGRGKEPNDPCHQANGRRTCGIKPQQTAEVCYYTKSHFRGAHFCSKPGENVNRLPARWNDKISSIRVIGRASTKVCADKSLGGKCILIMSNRTRLNGLDDAISSYRIH